MVEERTVVSGRRGQAFPASNYCVLRNCLQLKRRSLASPASTPYGIISAPYVVWNGALHRAASSIPARDAACKAASRPRHFSDQLEAGKAWASSCFKLVPMIPRFGGHIRAPPNAPGSARDLAYECRPVLRTP